MSLHLDTGKILVIGSGGREHAIAHKVLQSDRVSTVFVAPGNPGIESSLSRAKMKYIEAADNEALLKFALSEQIELTIVGPESALSNGLVDLFLANNLLIVGPTKKAGQLETSKAFAKKIMIEANVPTAGYAEFFNPEVALQYIHSQDDIPMVVKCDGLAAGKGVIVCQNKIETGNAVNALMKNKLLGDNIDHIIIEEFLEGIEVSAFALCDGNTFSFLGTACDHKRLLDGDKGPNTGGMGVFSPASIWKSEDELWINENVFGPMVKAMKKKGMPFSGILFAGLMKTKLGWKVLEFNVRFGDPETQVLMPLIDEDLFPWFHASASGNIAELQTKLGRPSPKKSNLVGVHVVMAAYGYPGTKGIKVRSGDKIIINDDFKPSHLDYLYFAGVDRVENNLVTKGGRVLGVTSLEENFQSARKNAYDLISKIHFEGSQYRKDIASGQL